MSHLKKIIFAAVYTACMHALTSIKLCFIFGSKLAFFSFNQCLTPVSGFFLGTKHNAIIFVLRTALASWTIGLTFAALTYHLPTLGGTIYLTTRYPLLRLGVPLLCILLFIAHPVGAPSALYTLYWLPPCIMALSMPQSIFLRSLASTLTTHAVGSVFWLYTHQTDVLFWHSLLTVVWIERLLFASFMTAAYYGVIYASKMFNYSIKNSVAASSLATRSIV